MAIDVDNRSPLGVPGTPNPPTDAVFRDMDKIFRGMILREVSDAELAESLAVGLCVIRDGKRIPVSEFFKFEDDDEDDEDD
jgi:hypothetical protein